MAQAFVALGSNLHNPIMQVQQACAWLDNVAHTTLLCSSPLYRTAPVGIIEQPDFINAVVKMQTSLSPEQLLEQCLKLELQAGRVRAQRNGPRTLDLDIILYDDIIYNSPNLTLPHPRAFERAFVVVPLWHVAPELILPNGTRLADLAQHFSAHDMIAIEPGDKP